ncbi:hypothetical protein F5148DRAFT_1369654 [Russula earlei]|uniref:Uncharacterized protein n=1 Tax=Russula earlei TaxID=71964 RepID=A0ACC0U1E6_9AGAM|nr:hypothetical protein F5148DRAFT_1369654 [Russula earlei]
MFLPLLYLLYGYRIHVRGRSTSGHVAAVAAAVYAEAMVARARAVVSGNHLMAMATRSSPLQVVAARMDEGRMGDVEAVGNAEAETGSVEAVADTGREEMSEGTAADETGAATGDESGVGAVEGKTGMETGDVEAVTVAGDTAEGAGKAVDKTKAGVADKAEAAAAGGANSVAAAAGNAGNTMVDETGRRGSDLDIES